MKEVIPAWLKKALGGQCHILSQQTSYKQERQSDKACFQGLTSFCGPTVTPPWQDSFLPSSTSLIQ